MDKIYLIKYYFKEKYCFYHTSIANVDMAAQLQNFTISLQKYGSERSVNLKDWFESSERLKEIIKRNRAKRKASFIEDTNSKIKTVLLCMFTMYGLKQNAQSGLVQNDLISDMLFED